MDQLLKLTQDVGMKPSQGQDALGGILKLVQSNVSSADFSKIEAAVPGAGSAAANAETKASEDPTAKLMSSAMGMFGGAKKNEGSSTGGTGNTALDSIPQLLAFAAKSGINAKQLTALLPLVAKFLQSNANVDASSVLGTTASGGGGGAAATAPGGSTSSGGIDTNNLAQQAQGFLGGFMKK
eukprot:scaffold6506_cov171-Amphora_coffeaeformis.AAC.6